METTSLVTICLTSFLAVMLLLSLLALIMRGITIIFPPKDDDDAVIAAISSTYQSHFPGTRITKIGEQK